jgi:hypothetical protein
MGHASSNETLLKRDELLVASDSLVKYAASPLINSATFLIHNALSPMDRDRPEEREKVCSA